jgi:hypothetical protein
MRVNQLVFMHQPVLRKRRKHLGYSLYHTLYDASSRAKVHERFYATNHSVFILQYALPV